MGKTKTIAGISFDFNATTESVVQRLNHDISILEKNIENVDEHLKSSMQKRINILKRAIETANNQPDNSEKTEAVSKNTTHNVDKTLKFEKVMYEWKKGRLKTSAGELVRYPEDKTQAIAIAYSESGLDK